MKRISIRRRLIYSVALLFIVVSSGLIGYNLYNSLQDAKHTNEARIYSESVERGLLIESYLHRLYEVTAGLAITTEEIRDNDLYENKRESLENIAKGIVLNNDAIVGITFAFESNTFDNLDKYYDGNNKYGKNGEFTPNIFMTEDGVKISSVDNLSLQDLYVIPKSTSKPVITEPYFYKVNNVDKLISTLSIPIFDNGEFIGVVGANIAMDKITDVIAGSTQGGIPLRSVLVTNEGTIVVNSESYEDRLQLISKYYLEYNKDTKMIDSDGSIQRYTKDKYQVLLPVDLGETNTNWYLFSDIDTNEITAKIYKQIGRQVLLVALLTVIALIILARTISRVLSPLVAFTNQIGNFNVDDLESESFEVEETRLKEMNILAKAYNNLIEKVYSEFEIKNRRDKLLRDQKEIVDLLQRNRNLHDLATKLIRVLTKKSNGQLGIFYVRDNSNDETVYYRTSSYAYYSKENRKYSFHLGEGLVGQAAVDKEIHVMKYLPNDYYNINSGVGEALPNNLVIVPCVVSDEVVAIFEIGSLHQFDDEVIEYLESIRFDIGSTFESIIAYEKTKELLQETTEQRKELDLRKTELESQQEELRVTNEELESQQEELRVANEELESQQEELRVANEELEAIVTKLELNNKELEDARLINKEKAEELEKLNKYKSEFLANMSHELRTPLNSILILSELLQENENLNDKELEYTKTIKRSGQDLLELINDVLDLSKVEAGKETVKLSNVEVCTLLKELELDFNPISIKNNVEYKTLINEDVPNVISTDYRKVKQILKNLITNAIKFTKDGMVKVNASRDADYLYINVEDDGIGISRDKLDDIFSAFNQEDGSISRRYGGTGLGLSISKEYALLLGGDITVKSEQNVGSTFTLSLPITEINDYSENIKDTNEDSNPECVLESHYVKDDRLDISNDDDVILLVDDDKDFTNVVMSFLNNKGYKVIATDTGENALHLADYYLPKAILLDMNLPGMNGSETSKRLKDNRRTKDIPVYIISGDESKSENMYQKPIEFELLEGLLNNNSSKNILVIEDNDVQRQSIVNYISEKYKDVQVYDSASGADALIKLTKYDIDLIVLDLVLKDYTNSEFIDALRNTDVYKDIPVILYTGKELTEEDEIELSQKVDDIIIKGETSIKRLLDEIKIFLHKVEKKSVNDTLEDFKDKTVLIVDDDMRNIFSLSSLLESNGIKIKFSTNGLDGIEILENDESIDLVLMDIMMPEMDGYETMKRIRSKEKFNDLPIIALTAKAMKGDRAKCIEAGANEYCSKPIDKNKLLSLLRVWL